MQRLLEKINAHPRATLIAVGTTVFGAAALVILLMFLSLRESVVNPTVTPEEEKMVLSEVIKNNPSGVINNPGNSSTPMPSPNPTPVPTPNPTPGVVNPNPETPQPEQPVAPNINEYNYRVTRVTNQRGPSFDACQMYYGGGYGYGPGVTEKDSVSEYYEYFERYVSIYKNQIKEDNKLSSYYLSKYGRSVNSTTYYLEGSYAVENSYKPYDQFDNQQDTQVVSYPTYTADEYIKLYFGSNASVTGVETDSSGVKHYTIRSSYTSYCDPTYDQYLISDVVPPALRTIYSVYRVNGQTFSIEQIKTYIDEVKDANLIKVSTTESTRSKVTYTQVEAQFRIASNVPITKNDYSHITYNYDPLKSIRDNLTYLAMINDDILLPSSTEGLTNLWVDGYVDANYVNSTEFYQDRDFFPDSDWGDELYARYNTSANYVNKTLYSISITPEYGKYYSISAYKDDQLFDDIISELMKGTATSKSIEDITINVSGLPVEGKKISKVFTYKFPTSYGVSYPVSYSSDSNTNYFTNYVFEYNGRVYGVSYYSYNQQMDLDMNEYSIYPLTTELEAETMRNLLTDMWSRYLQIVNPVSYPTSFPVSYSY